MVTLKLNNNRAKKTKNGIRQLESTAAKHMSSTYFAHGYSVK